MSKLSVEIDKRKKLFLEKLDNINGDIFELVGEYKTLDKETLFKCKKCENIFSSTPYNTIRRKRKSCKNCLYKNKVMKNYNIEEIDKNRNIFLNKFHKKFSENEFEYISGFIDLKSQCRFKCGKCKNDNYWITPDSIMKKKNINCNLCRNSHNHQNIEEYIEDIYEKYHNKFTINLEDNLNYKNSSSIITIKCNKCKNKFTSQAKGFKYRGKCSYCNMTPLEKRTYDILLEYYQPSDIEIQKGFDDLLYKNSQKFDFYIKKENLAIEVDGKQHVNIDAFGRIDEDSHKRDINKNNYCKNKNIKLIRILYNQGIETVLITYFEHNIIPRNIFTINI